ncbi:hypothetical protein GW796_09550 [archaeon]|nr:hypothetical protein [archaeon]
MNDIRKEKIFNTLNRLSEKINSNELIKKLSNLVKIDTAVVGGSIRDIILNKEIKDIDISITLDFNVNLTLKNNIDKDIMFNQATLDHGSALKYREKEVVELIRVEKIKGANSSSDLIDFDYHEYDNNAVNAIVSIISEILNASDDYSVDCIFTNKILDRNIKISDTAYFNIGLCAVLKVTDKKSEFPIDVLITTDSVAEFINCFDFNLCKTYMVNNEGVAQIVKPLVFIKDCENMTITYSPRESVTEAKMSKSLMVRYPRLREKLSEYKLVADTSVVENKNIKEMIAHTIKVINLTKDLSNMKINTTNTIKKLKKI